MKKQLLILGAGPSGLSCAYELCAQGLTPILWERHEQVGGLCRTIEYRGCRFDVGPHRFFTRNDEVDALWHSVTAPDVVNVQRLTRIFYRNHLFSYPLRPLDALIGLGLPTSVKAMLAYVWQRATPSKKPPDNFEEWVVREFGWILYAIFFKTYTEKVWGINCSSISAEWAAQRIKGLNLGKTLIHSLLPWLNRKGSVKSLVDRFDYPRLGAGQTYDKMAAHVIQEGGAIELHTTGNVINHDKNRVTEVEGISHAKNCCCLVEHLFSSIPLTEFIFQLRPMAPERVLAAAKSLYYRDHITVNLIVNHADLFPDNWIYVHAPEVRVARIANYVNFSQKMHSSPLKTALSVEYFVYDYEPIWQMNDADLITLAKKELSQLGLLKMTEVEDGFVLREQKAYPTYFTAYQNHLEVIKEYVANFKNVTLIGRGGMYRYNNQDHSILCGILAAKNFTGNSYNLWKINEEQEFLEEKQLPSPAHAGPMITR